jgi:hypothetical protein
MIKKFLWIAGILGLCGALLWWWHWHRQMAPWEPALQSRAVATRVLAEHLAKRYPGSKALVLGNPFTQRPDQKPEIYAFDQAELAGFEQGFNQPGSVKEVFPELRPELGRRPESVFIDPKTTTPLSYLVAEDAFDRVIQRNPGFDLVVSLIGLPLNLPQARFWQENAKARLALLLPDWRMVGNAQAVREALKSEKIAAAVVARPGAIPEEERVEGDYQAAFDRRFLLVTKENIDHLLRSYPHLF